MVQMVQMFHDIILYFYIFYFFDTGLSQLAQRALTVNRTFGEARGGLQPVKCLYYQLLSYNNYSQITDLPDLP